MAVSVENTRGADVLVVGGGPVGLTAAAELARHGVRCRVVDKLATPSPFCRALGITPRTLEVWDDMGIARSMIDAGLWLTGTRTIMQGHAHDAMHDYSDLPFAELCLPQNETERLLAEHLGRFGVAIERGVTLESLAQANGRVTTVLTNANGDREAAEFKYVIGCDGAHSAVRRALNIAFDGEAMPYGFMLGDVKMDWNLPRGLSCFSIHPIENAAPDLFIAIPLPEEGRYRVSMFAPPELAGPASGTEHGIQSERPAPGIAHLQTVADRLLPEKVTLSDMRWSSIYRISIRLADHYRVQNVFIAGDAAHIHPPTGGQGMNTGMQDAYNLAWKLALVMKGDAPESLLDSYHIERHAVGEDVIHRTLAATMKLDRSKKEPSDRLADTQILITYRGSPAVENPTADQARATGPLAGDRVPDAQGITRAGVGFPIRLHHLLHGTQHVLLAYLPGADPNDAVADLVKFVAEQGIAKLVRTVAIVEPTAKATDRYGVSIYHDSAGNFVKTFGFAPTAMLVRPDGYLAWRGGSVRDAGLVNRIAATFTATARQTS